MKPKNDLDKKLAKLDSEHQTVLYWNKILFRSAFLPTLLFVVMVLRSYFNWDWWNISGLIVSGGIAIILFAGAFALRWLTNLNIGIFLRYINSKCHQKYEQSELMPSLKEALRKPISLVWLGNYMIQSSYPSKSNISSIQREKNDELWIEETDKLLQETLAAFPTIDLRLRRRIVNALGNRHMHKRDKHILFLSIYSYLNPDAEDGGRIKKLLGPWHGQIPKSSLQQKLSDSLIEATKPTAFIAPVEKIPKKKTVSTTSPAVTKPKVNRKTSQKVAEDVFIDLNEEIETLFPLEQVAELVADEGVDPKLVWSILVSLLQLGKSTAIAGGWNRREVLILNHTKKRFDMKQWKYPGNKECSRTIDWLVKEKVLVQRKHHRDFGVDFHVRGKNSAGRGLSTMMNSAKSHRTSN